MILLNSKPIDDNELAHGMWEHYYDNGTLAYKGSFIHGNHSGFWILYYEDGSLYCKRY